MTDHDEALAGRYEAVFGVFMAAAAFLWRDGGGWTDPALLGLFAALMALNLAATCCLRRWPGRPEFAAAITLGNCGVVAAIVERSGGPESHFWVLYLLPIYSSCLLLGARETLLITAGALALDCAGAMPEWGVWSAGHQLGLAIKTAVLAVAAALTFRLAERDRAARRRLDAQRRKLEESASLASVGMMSAGVAHDLSNALMVTMGFTEVALAEATLSPEVKADLEAIRGSTTMARRIAASFMDAARPSPSELEAVDLNESLREALDLSRGGLRRAAISLIVDLEDGLPRVQGSRTQLQRVFLNLLGNATRALSGREATLTVSSETRAGEVVITVEDDGPGLPEAVAATLFQAFARGGAPEGHGLGLHVCSEIARGHGGRLQGENKPEGGARFALFLPVAARTEETATC